MTNKTQLSVRVGFVGRYFRKIYRPVYTQWSHGTVPTPREGGVIELLPADRITKQMVIQNEFVGLSCGSYKTLGGKLSINLAEKKTGTKKQVGTSNTTKQQILHAVGLQRSINQRREEIEFFFRFPKRWSHWASFFPGHRNSITNNTCMPCQRTSINASSLIRASEWTHYCKQWYGIAKLEQAKPVTEQSVLAAKLSKRWSLENDFYQEFKGSSRSAVCWKLLRRYIQELLLDRNIFFDSHCPPAADRSRAFSCIFNSLQQNSSLWKPVDCGVLLWWALSIQ